MFSVSVSSTNPGLPDFIKGHGSLLVRYWLSESMNFVSEGVKTVLAYLEVFSQELCLVFLLSFIFVFFVLILSTIFLNIIYAAHVGGYLLISLKIWGGKKNHLSRTSTAFCLGGQVQMSTCLGLTS